MNSQTQFADFDEPTLTQKASKGDLESFNQLVLHYQNLAYNHAYALLGDADLAEDATQVGFINAFQAMSGYRGGPFRSWLLKIVTNCAYDLMRRAYRHPSQPLFPADENGEEIESASWLVDPSASVEDTVEQNEFSRHLYELVDELPEVYRTVITMIDIDELEYAEAAEVLGVPIGTIKSRLARARLQLQKKLNGYVEAPINFTRATASCGI